MKDARARHTPRFSETWVRKLLRRPTAGGADVAVSYRFGLPFDAGDRAGGLEDVLVLQEARGFALSAGTVARMQTAMSGFREIAGVQLIQPCAIPGLRLRSLSRTSWTVGAGITFASVGTSASGVATLWQFGREF